MNDTKTVSGAIVHVTDADEAPLVKCLVDITPKQSGTGTPSPSNVRPINGWESVNVTDAGKNLLTKMETSGTVSGVTYTVQSDGSVKAVGTSTGAYPKYIWTDGKHLPAGNYIMSAGDEVTANGVRLSCTIKRAGGNTQYYECTSSTERPFTVYADDQSMSVYMRTNGGSTAINATVYPMIRLASDTDAIFAPYNGHTTTTSLGRTVYGGTLDVVSGVLTVDKVGVDMGTLSWTYSTSYPTPIFAVTVDSLGALKNSDRFMSSIYNSKLRFWTEAGNDYCVASGNGSVNVSNSNYTSASAFKTGMSGTLLVYELATPQTYTLTGQEVSAMYGENYIWASSGDTTIEYTYLPYGLYGEIRLDGEFLPKPRDFKPGREDVYAGEYTTCTGKTIADKIGWKFSDLDLQWDALKQSDIDKLINLTNACSLRFDDADGLHTEDVIRTSAVSLRNRNTIDGVTWWRDVSAQFKFINTHNE